VNDLPLFNQPTQRILHHLLQPLFLNEQTLVRIQDSFSFTACDKDSLALQSLITINLLER
jgi:hypothetical protein